MTSATTRDLTDTPLVFSHSISNPYGKDLQPSNIGNGQDVQDDEKRLLGNKAWSRRRDEKDRSNMMPEQHSSSYRWASPMWQHDSSDTQPNSTLKNFSHRQQQQKILTSGLQQWLVTLVLVLCLFAVLLGFDRLAMLNNSQKRAFNALMTLFSVCLSLSIITALRSYAKLVKWRILASRYYSLDQFELAMQFHSYWEALRLLYADVQAMGLKANTVQISCAASLLMILGFQMLVAFLGMTYSVDVKQGFISWAWGSTSILDLTQLAAPSLAGAATNGLLPSMTGAVNYYGLIGQSMYYNSNPGNVGIVSIDRLSPSIYRYTFLSTAAQDNSDISQLTGQSDRSVNSTATCMELPIIKGGYATDNAGEVDLTFDDEYGVRHDIIIPGAMNLTSVYMSNSSEASSCGSRCTQVYVLDVGGMTNKETTGAAEQGLMQPKLFACNSTVSEVKNSQWCENPEQCTLSDRFAQYYAGAIGFSGQVVSNSPLQYKVYPIGSAFTWTGVSDQSTDSARESYVASFAVCAFQGIDMSGARLTVQDWYPIPAQGLNVQWQYAGTILGCIPVLQLLALLVVCSAAKDTLIKDSGYLGAARLLRPVVEQLGDHGSTLTSDEIARKLKNVHATYGTTELEDLESFDAKLSKNPDSVRQVDLLLRISTENQDSDLFGRHQRFPDGKYD